MVGGTSVVWLPVSDIDRSITFYRDRLGLSELQHEGHWAQLDANGLHIGLNATESPRGNGGAVIAFQPQDGLESADGAARRWRRDRRGHQRSPLGPSRDPQGPRRQRPAALRASGLNQRAEWDARDAASHSVARAIGAAGGWIGAVRGALMTGLRRTWRGKRRAREHQRRTGGWGSADSGAVAAASRL
jgi:catechol 2,3-dioxygenase-like lactoylglutathione lyase family enzyme